MIALYLDKLNENMEKMLLERMPKNVDIRFLNPSIGKKGELADADVLIDTTYRVTKEVIDNTPNLKLIQRTGIGTDMVDVAYAKAKGIPISICKGFNSVSVAELAILNMLALYRRLPFMDATMKKGEWHTWTYRHASFELTGKTVGIVGAGAIGRHVMQRVKAFDCEVLYYDLVRMFETEEQKFGAVFCELDKLLSTADVITLHLPLLPATKGMIGAEQLHNMKASAILINTARDLLIDLDALAEAMLKKEIMGAAIDVLDPLTEASPLYKAKDTNLILTPHIGAATFDNYDRVFKLCARNLLHLMNNEPFEGLLK